MRGLRAAWGSGAEVVSADEAVSVRMLGFMRALLALSCLIVALADPRVSRALLAALAGYGIYSVALAAAHFYGRSLVPSRLQSWLDMLFYASLVWLAAAASSVFLGFLFFLLALLGGMFAWWGRHQLAVTRRLRLLNDLMHFPNPRLGVDHALTQYLRQLRACLDADACVLVCARAGVSDYVMYRVDASHAALPGAQPLTERAAQPLLALPADASLAWDARWRRDGPHAGLCDGLANLLENSCFVTAPYAQPGTRAGRIYVAADRRFGRSALELVRQAAAQIAASVDKMALLEELTENVAQGERSRISRDIHDTTIQPYVGLKLGLEALQRRLDARSAAAEQVGELVDMCTLALEDLRGYVARLRGRGKAGTGEGLVSALHQQAGRYRRFYGVEVEVRGDPGSVKVCDRLAANAYQIACEALSNVYRHTHARHAFVDLRCGDRSLALEIGNERDAARPAAGFMPRSIAERAAALGGMAEVRLDAGHDVVRVTIPL